MRTSANPTVAKRGRADDPRVVPDQFALYPTYPNPFSGSAHIRFHLPRSERVEVKIYNVVGQEVRTLVKEEYAAGTHTIAWNGMDRRGVAVASGLYLCRMTAGQFVQTRRMSLVR